MDIDRKDTAVLVTDLQNDFLSEDGVTWQLVGDSVKENKTIENLERIFRAAADSNYKRPFSFAPHAT